MPHPSIKLPSQYLRLRKTRLLLEGLCAHWGFYFTSLVDSSRLGSSDVQNTIETHLPHTPHFKVNLPPPGSSGYQAALDVKREIAGSLFKKVFLARLVLFSAFVETMTRWAETEYPCQ